ncbi:uncharacterized protein EI90DRAFT_3208365 [Cantharellus anzutake]|uniref:uncharacterized protein n=1 Tax=Cantharellus anzutake TaxID=1750568 RepID=UPI0019074F61|nr:uncharacterized protein EI90DRAFT_3208365 [Cantharellus anzutake]KAF8342236.1 hypothetical protein EI90DRAFT_3208365 [Cantharellus anzutake]
MPLPRVEETDEDFDAVRPPLVGRTPSYTGAFLLNSTYSRENFGETDNGRPDDFFEAESGLNVLHTIEPLEGNESTRLIASTQPRPLRQSLTIFSNFSIISGFSTFSKGSNLSIRSSGKTFSLRDLCKNVIEEHLWLQTARIISTSCYSQYRNLILHRFLILQLRRPGKRDIWLRIDRRAGLSPLKLAQKLGKTRANDTAQLSASEKDLTRKARQENIQIFKRPPFLGDFGVYLRVICEELLEYRVWPENCWMFCSLLQEHLGISGDGDYTFGIPVARNIASLVRQRISERVVADVAPNTIMAVLQSLAQIFIPKWQPLSFTIPKGWHNHSIAVFFAQTVYPSWGLDILPNHLLKWIASFQFPNA